MKHLLAAVLASGLFGCVAQQRAVPSSDALTPPVYRMEELTWTAIDALDRDSTLIILPVGMLEQHGPHLPVGSDTLAVAYEANFVAQRVSRTSPGWSVVMMPAIAYGHSGANNLGDLPIHPGTYALRQSTFRALLADVGAQLAQNGFKWIFVLNGHGAPSHAVATDEACHFVSERFGVTMLDVTALFRADQEIQARGAEMNARFFSPAEIASFGMDVHAGVGETAGMLAIRPDLVRPNYRTLPSQSGGSFEELRAIATAPGWQGYLSAPALATPQYGAAVETWWIDGTSQLIVQTIRGEDMAARPGQPATIPLPIAPMIERALANEAAFEAELAAWLSQRRR
jgi:creatinine amidohydrolase